MPNSKALSCLTMMQRMNFLASIPVNLNWGICWDRVHTDDRYAMKKLGRHSLNHPHRYIAAVIDLAFEARFLSVFRRPNIIKMRAVAISSLHYTEFFIIHDRLYDTLSILP